jgi:bifunctional UDP-N-acetylglucosamine pyrophosphorylase/glucosamine-1-phosphate N-acetyltransferase
MQAVLLVAGKSTRTYPLTLTRPKPLLPILNKPLIKYSLDQMQGLFDQVVLIVGYRQEQIRETLGTNYKGIEIIYQEQKQQLGTGHAILEAQPHITGQFVALNGDDLFAHEDLKNLMNFKNGALVKKVKDPSRLGVYQVDQNNKVKNLVEKPKTYIGNLANIGCYIFEPSVFDVIRTLEPSERGEIEITDAISIIAKRQDFKVLPITGYWLSTGYAWDLLVHQEYFGKEIREPEILGTVEEGAHIKGPVRVGEKTIIKAGAYIDGPVVIGDNCIIGPNCYVRGITSIGNNCIIGNAVEIKNSILMDSVQICHLSYVGDSIVGRESNLGAGTITANKRHDDTSISSFIKGKLVDSGRTKLGAILADQVHTGIHTSIYPGRKIWPNMTTRPGSIVNRDYIPAEQEW